MSKWHFSLQPAKVECSTINSTDNWVSKMEHRQAPIKIKRMQLATGKMHIEILYKCLRNTIFWEFYASSQSKYYQDAKQEKDLFNIYTLQRDQITFSTIAPVHLDHIKMSNGGSGQCQNNDVDKLQFINLKFRDFVKWNCSRQFVGP